MKDFEAWWATEPFGFDHPDTKSGIFDLLAKRDRANRKLEADLMARKIHIALLEQTVAKMREALEFYGDIENWQMPFDGYNYTELSDDDRDLESKKGNRKISGRRARQALKEFDEILGVKK